MRLDGELSYVSFIVSDVPSYCCLVCYHCPLPLLLLVHCKASLSPGKALYK